MHLLYLEKSRNYRMILIEIYKQLKVKHVEITIQLLPLLQF